MEKPAAAIADGGWESKKMVRNGYLEAVLAKGLDTPLRYHLKVVCPTDSDSHA